MIPSMPRDAAFAIPGDIDQKTGGYIYEKSLLLALRAAGRRVEHIELPAGFPLGDARGHGQPRSSASWPSRPTCR